MFPAEATDSRVSTTWPWLWTHWITTSRRRCGVTSVTWFWECSDVLGISWDWFRWQILNSPQLIFLAVVLLKFGTPFSLKSNPLKHSDAFSSSPALISSTRQASQAVIGPSTLCDTVQVKNYSLDVVEMLLKCCISWTVNKWFEILESHHPAGSQWPICLGNGLVCSWIPFLTISVSCSGVFPQGPCRHGAGS